MEPMLSTLIENLASRRNESCRRVRTWVALAAIALNCTLNEKTGFATNARPDGTAPPLEVRDSIGETNTLPSNRMNLAAVDGRSVFEAFKAFIENPPAIESLVFTYSGSEVTRYDSMRNRWIKEPSFRTLIRSEWGPERFLNTTVPDSGSPLPIPLPDRLLLTNSESVLQMKDDFWSFSGRLNRATYWRGPLSYPLDLSNPVILEFHCQTLPLFAILNAGAHLMPPRSIHWLGNRFRHSSHVLQQSISIEGEINVGPDDRPRFMTLRYVGPNVDGHYIVRYYFAQMNDLRRPAFIPQRIQCVLLKEGIEIPDKEINILSLKLGAATNSMTPFNPAGWSRQAALTNYVYTNHALYVVETNGQARLIQRGSSNPRPPLALAHANRYYYVTCALTSFGFLVAHSRLRRQREQQNQK